MHGIYKDKIWSLRSKMLADWEGGPTHTLPRYSTGQVCGFRASGGGASLPTAAPLAAAAGAPPAWQSWICSAWGVLDA